MVPTIVSKPNFPLLTTADWIHVSSAFLHQSATTVKRSGRLNTANRSQVLRFLPRMRQCSHCLQEIRDPRFCKFMSRVLCKKWSKRSQTPVVTHSNFSVQREIQTPVYYFSTSLWIHTLRFLVRTTLHLSEETVMQDTRFDWMMFVAAFVCDQWMSADSRRCIVLSAETSRGDHREHLWPYTRSICQRWVILYHEDGGSACILKSKLWAPGNTCRISAVSLRWYASDSRVWVISMRLAQRMGGLLAVCVLSWSSFGSIMVNAL